MSDWGNFSTEDASAGGLREQPEASPSGQPSGQANEVSAADAKTACISELGKAVHKFEMK